MNSRKRKSVIVKHSSQEVACKVDKLDEEITTKSVKTVLEVKTMEVDNSLVQIDAAEKVKLDLDIPAINAMCTNYLVQEEKTHLEII